MNSNRINVYATAKIGLLNYALAISIDPALNDGSLRPVPRKHGRLHMWDVPTSEATVMKSRRTAMKFVFAAIVKKSPRQVNGFHDELGFALETADAEVEKILKNAAWRQTAGCSCGCSPGFILPGFPYDIYCTFSPVAA